VTKLKMLYTGERGVEFQYRIKVLGQDKRFIALKRIWRSVIKRKKKRCKASLKNPGSSQGHLS